MTDLLPHLIDAPLANILILAGLGFLAVAVLGKISGKIEPGTGSRAMSGVLGIVLVLYGVHTHSATDAQAAPQAASKAEPTANEKAALDSPKPRPPRKAGRLTGTWTNDNTQTRGITKLEIEERGKAVTVRAWGACHPTDCDWGTEKGLMSDGATTIAWDQGFVLRKMTLTPDAPRLRIELDSVYRDSRPPQHGQEYFVKSD
jgi:hypothetical protein